MPRTVRVRRTMVALPSDPSYRLIPLTQNQFAKVDAEDFSILSRTNWHAHWYNATQSFYAEGRPNGESNPIKMHRFLMNAEAGQQVDHINGDTLDNRRSNLRLCGHADNVKNAKKRKDNTSGFRGVSFKDGKWRARINVNGNPTFIGNFANPIDAATAYNEAAKKYHGEFARINPL